MLYFNRRILRVADESAYHRLSQLTINSLLDDKKRAKAF